MVFRKGDKPPTIVEEKRRRGVIERWRKVREVKEALRLKEQDEKKDLREMTVDELTKMNKDVKDELNQMNQNAQQEQQSQQQVFDKVAMMKKNKELADNAKAFIQPWAEAFNINTGDVVKKVIYQGITKGNFDLGSILGINDKKEKEMKFVKIVKTLAVWLPVSIFIMSIVVVFVIFEIKILTVLMGKI